MADEPIEAPGLEALATRVRQARIRCEFIARPVKAGDYRIQVGKVERVPRMVIPAATQAA